MAMSGLQLRTLVKPEGELELSLVPVDVPDPGPDEIVIKVEATPINPSDLGLLVGPADLSTAQASTRDGRPVLTAKIAPQFMRMMAARAGESMPVGNEGAGVVVAAGSSPAAQALMGKAVAGIGGAMYAQYRTLRAQDVLPLPPGATPKDGASCFVNPLTALAFPEVMRMENHTALVHTAAASNLGQMLVKICLKDGVPLVNIVRSDAQAQILKDIGATHVLNSSAPNFMEDLIKALTETKATLAFDAIGGGPLAGQLLTGFLIKIGPEAGQKLRQRVIDELKTTFASHYTAEISLAETLDPAVIAAYQKKATGEKFLINPAKGL